MKIKDIYLDALRELGYTEAEARFLYIVGTHSGYFTSQHYLDFSDRRGCLNKRAIAPVSAIPTHSLT